LQPFDYIVPTSLEEASRLLLEGDGSVRCLQGGTDLLIRIRGGFVQPERVLDLKVLPGMREIRSSPDGWLVIGAACTMNQVGLHPLVCERYDVLAQGANSVASYQLRNRATIGGNCCNASPAADTAPALLCLEAVAEVFGPEGARRIPIDEFFTGPGRAAIHKGEFLTGIHLPPHSGARSTGAYNKLGRTKLGDIAVVSVAVNCLAGRDEPVWRIAIGAAGPTPLRALQAEEALAQDASADGVARAAQLAAEAARPIDDIRGSAAYRKAMVRVLARRGIETVLSALGLPGVPPAAGGPA
jgi:CO/xanthine dehydrogenase FAD-binding subunit